MVASIYTTVVVALERYTAVSKPFDAYALSASAFSSVDDERRILFRRVLAPVLAFSMAFNLPTFFEFYVDNSTATGKKVFVIRM